MSELTYDVSDGSSNSPQSPDFTSGDRLTVDLDNDVADRTVASGIIDPVPSPDVLALAFAYLGAGGPVMRAISVRDVATLAFLGDVDGSDVSLAGDLAAVGITTVEFDGSGLADDVFDGSAVASGASLDLNGGAGADVLLGGDGNDEIEGGAGNDTLDGGSGNDVLRDGAGIDEVAGGAGDDEFHGALDAIEDDFLGGDGIDTIRYAAAAASVTVDLTGGGLPFGIASGAEIGADRLFDVENVQGGSGNDVLTGDAGVNVFFASPGDDAIDGGDGSDTYDASAAPTGVTIDLGQGFAQGFAIGHDTLTAIENAAGGSGADLLFGDAGHNLLMGHAGDDGLAGGAGNDAFIGGEGNDALAGGPGFDIAIFSGPRVDYSIDLELRTVTHDEGGDGVDSFSDLERLAFGDGVFFDIILPVPEDDSFASGPSGNAIFDVLANDTDDQGAPLEPEDVFSLKITRLPENGLAYVLEDDRIVYVGNEGFSGPDSFEYIVNTGQGADTARVDVLVLDEGSPPESVFSTGGNADESLVGTAVNNFLFAAGGDDDLLALLGGDVLQGGSGNDVLVADGAQNQLTGGPGADLFVLTHEPADINDFDTITDLVSGDGDGILVAVEGLVDEDGLIDSDRIGLRPIGGGEDSLLVADLDDDPETGEDGLEAILARLDGVAAPPPAMASGGSAAPDESFEEGTSGSELLAMSDLGDLWIL